MFYLTIVCLKNNYFNAVKHNSYIKRGYEFVSSIIPKVCVSSHALDHLASGLAAAEPVTCHLQIVPNVTLVTRRSAYTAKGRCTLYL